MSKSMKINVTKDYKLFHIHEENRPQDLAKHRDLERSMQEYGFIPSYHIICRRDEKGRLWVADGQHRLAFAIKLGLPVHWTEEETDFNIAKVNSTQVKWTPLDYVTNFSERGSEDYTKLLAFKEEYGIPLTTAATILAGTTTFHNITNAFYSGEFKIKDEAWGRTVAGLYTSLIRLQKELKGNLFLSACMSITRVPAFSPKRMLQGAERARQELVCYGTRDAYLNMLEAVYNFGAKNPVPLKLEAVKAMKKRNARYRNEKQGDADGEVSPPTK
jgi:hypothetical protein